MQPWYYGLMVYRFGLSKTDGDEMQSEYFVPYKYSIKAMKAVSIECYLIGKMKVR